jgi:hypothetical protein
MNTAEHGISVSLLLLQNGRRAIAPLPQVSPTCNRATIPEIIPTSGSPTTYAPSAVNNNSKCPLRDAGKMLMACRRSLRWICVIFAGVLVLGYEESRTTFPTMRRL